MDDAALAIVVSVGMYLLKRHLPLNLGEAVRIPTELETNAERLVVVSADELLRGLGLCRGYEPLVEVLWLQPDGVADRRGLGE